MDRFIVLSEEQKQRFLKYTTKTECGCVLWTGTVSGCYGRITINKRSWQAHHIGFILHHGVPIPSGQVVRHKCPGFHNMLCVNGEHLELGTQKQNMLDAVGQNSIWRRRGQDSPLATLTDAQVSEIKKLLISGELNQTRIAQKFQINHRTINAIRQGKSWRHIDPQIPSIIPKPHRVFTDEEYLDIRNKWREGLKLKEIAALFNTRVDTIQHILSGKRGKNVPVGERILRLHKHLLTPDEKIRLLTIWEKGEHTQKELSSLFGISHGTVWNIIHGKYRNRWAA